MTDGVTAGMERPAERFPRIAFELGRARMDAAYWDGWEAGDGPPLGELDHGALLIVAGRALKHVEALLALLEDIETAIPDPRPTTLEEVIAPIRAYLAWALDVDGPLGDGAHLLEDFRRVGQPTVRAAVELEVLGPGGNGSVPRPGERSSDR
ncbi:hypothetical protein ACIGXM_24350 [Kitasatospora sp. NPDC052896]|uniref:hypothetical protein n=1 Tax=Kitasatospora sp. NPDC052896 TaxID=3364061 RepID=UPI0037C72F89